MPCGKSKAKEATLFMNPDANASVTACVKAVWRVPADIRRHQACARVTQGTTTVSIGVIHKVRHLSHVWSFSLCGLQKLLLLPQVQGREIAPVQILLGLSSQWTRALSFSAKEFYRDEKG